MAFQGPACSAARGHDPAALDRLALVVVVAAVVVWAVHDSGDDGSALRSNGAILGGRVESGRPFAYGSLVVYNRESEPVVLRDVRLSGLSGTANLRLIGSYAVNPRKTPNLVRSFPRGVPRKALDGTPVKPHDGGVAVLLTLVKGRGRVCRLISPVRKSTDGLRAVQRADLHLRAGRPDQNPDRAGRAQRLDDRQLGGTSRALLGFRSRRCRRRTWRSCSGPSRSSTATARLI